MEENSQLMSILQISDSGFPTGGFSHSGGLEAALNVHNVTDKESLKQFLLCGMENCGSFLLPFMRESYQLCGDGEDLIDLDNLCDISTTNHVARRASTRQGSSLLDTSQRVFGLPELDSLSETLPCKHFPVVYGAVCAALGISLPAASLSFVYNTLRTVVASAVRLDRVGPIEAQRIQKELQVEIPAVIERHKQRVGDHAVMIYPHIDLIQNVHDILFTKLFYS